MYISDRIVYLQTQKTGGTHIARVLEKHDGGNTLAKHQPLKDWAANADKIIITSVRNPWDWYVSLWAYGCSGRGGLAAHLQTPPLQRFAQASVRSLKQSLTGRKRPGYTAPDLATLRAPNLAGTFRDLLSDAENTAHFRRWLTLILGEEGKALLPEGYAQSSLKHEIGYFSYRFLRLATRYDVFIAQCDRLQRYDEIVAFYNEHKILDHVIRNEALEEGLATVLNQRGLGVTAEVLRAEGKTNTSRRGSYMQYYDAQTQALVATRERFLIDLFGYEVDR